MCFTVLSHYLVLFLSARWTLPKFLYLLARYYGILELWYVPPNRVHGHQR